MNSDCFIHPRYFLKLNNKLINKAHKENQNCKSRTSLSCENNQETRTQPLTATKGQHVFTWKTFGGEKQDRRENQLSEKIHTKHDTEAVGHSCS